MMYEEKLYSVLPEEFGLPDYINLEDKVELRKAGNLPFICWPDGVPCVEANVYMRKLLHDGLSRRDGGGTLLTYAKNISPLIRFCHKNGWNFADLTDSSFKLFIHGLQAWNPVTRKQNTPGQVRKIGRTCVDFMITVQEFMGVNDLIGKKSKKGIKVCAITITREKVATGKYKNGKTRYKWVVKHDSFPTGNVKKKRHPISHDVVKKLKDAAGKIPGIFKRERTKLLIACFEETGGRRVEVASLRVKDIEEASEQDGSAPMLRMITVKKSNGGEDDEEKEEIRYLPVRRAFIQQAMRYIQRQRRRVISNTVGTKSDHGFLLVSQTTGKRLATGTLTTEMHSLCVAAGVDDEPGHPHLFRHAYCTTKIKRMIELHELENKDEFRKALIDIETMKQQLLQWTGHASTDSLEPYLDFAFAEMSNMGKVYSALHLTEAVSLVQDRLDYLKAEIKAGDATIPELMEELEELVGAFQEDIDISVAMEPEPEPETKPKAEPVEG